MVANLAKRERVAPSVITLDDGRYAPMLEIVDRRNEEAVIGSVLQKPELYITLAEILQPADFFFLIHGYIWHAFDQLSNTGKGIDLITIPDAMQSLNAPLQGEDLIRELVRMIGSAPDNRNAETYARAVFNSALRLRLLVTSDKIQQLARDKQQHIDGVIDECDRLIYAATNRKSEGKTDVQTAMGVYYDKVEQMILDGAKSPGISLGFEKLHGLSGGIYPGEVIVLAGGEGMGKTTWVLSGARNMLKTGKRGVLFTLEMTQEEILRIYTAMETGIYRSVLKSFDLSNYQWGLFTKAAGDIGNWPLDIIDEFPTLTPVQCRRKLRTLSQKQDIDFLIIDGLWLMEASEPTGERYRDVSLIMRDLNQIARDFHLPILITHQYSAEIRNMPYPTLYQLSESAGVRRNAQVIWGLHRPQDTENETGVTNIHILKDRNSSSTGEKIAFVYDTGHNCYHEIKA